MKKEPGELGRNARREFRQRVDLQSLVQTAVVVLTVVGAILAMTIGSAERLARVEEQHAQMIKLLEKQDKVIEEIRNQNQKLTALMDELIRQRRK